jgi:hypothetical protein
MAQQPDWQVGCMALLMGMHSGQEWSPMQTHVYALVLSSIGEEYSRAAVTHAVLNLKWRPAPAELRQIAARLASPAPTADEAFAEIVDRANRDGFYAKPDPENPNVRLAGPPPFSHPLVAQMVPLCGGWEHICNGAAGMDMGLKKQVIGAYPAIVEKWEQEVAQQLSLAPAQRNPKYFKPRKPYVPFTPEIEGEARLALPPAPEKRQEIDPKEAAAILRRIRAEHVPKAIPSGAEVPPEPKRSALAVDKATRERLEQEVRDRQAAVTQEQIDAQLRELRARRMIDG